MTSPVPDALRTQLAEVLRKHDVGAFSGSEIGCTCNRRWYPAAEWREHVADALAAALSASTTTEGDPT